MGKIALFIVPYHLSQEGIGMGQGPLRYLESGADISLINKGFDVLVQSINIGRSKNVLDAITKINADLARKVRAARNYFPLVLAGNCNVCLGTVSGLGSKVGVIWFDAHGDFNTPETTVSGYLDGMPLAILTGRCYSNVLSKLKSKVVEESNVILAGVRDLDPGESRALKQSAVNVVTAAEILSSVEAALLPRLLSLKSRTKEVYLHIDIDVIDPSEAPGVDYKAPDGLSCKQLEQCIALIAEHFRIRAAALTGFNPSLDEKDKTLKTGLRLINMIADIH